MKLDAALRIRYQRQGFELPIEILSALQMFSLTEAHLELVRQIESRGPKATASVETAGDILIAAGREHVTEDHVSNALIFMSITQDAQLYNAGKFVLAVKRSHFNKRLDWRQLIRGFDRDGLRVTAKQFLIIFDALLPIAEDESFDIQALWGGVWLHKDTQRSFLAAFYSSNVDVSRIRNFRPAFPLAIYSQQSVPQRLVALVDQVRKSPALSLDAANAFLDLLLASHTSWAEPESQRVKDAVQPSFYIFFLSMMSLSKPWSSLHTFFIKEAFMQFIKKNHEHYDFTLYGAWIISHDLVNEMLVSGFAQEPSCSLAILEQADEHGWLEYVLNSTSALSLELASLAHGRGEFSLEEWAKNVAPMTDQGFGLLLGRFLKIKADDEVRVSRKEPAAMIPLSIKTVHALLVILEDYLDDEALTRIQRMCVQTYPRLINYSEGFDDIIEANSQNGNSIPENTDKQMQALFGKMYHGELTLRKMLELMRQYKMSRNPADQDLFTCMVHGLIDEYHCYHEYPLEALTKTAVMFGGIVNFKLIQGIPLKVGLGMILDAVREEDPQHPMYKFGVEALEQMLGRLPEWVGFCSLLVQIPNLQGTNIYRKAEEVLHEHGHGADGDANRHNGVPEEAHISNGYNIDELLGNDAASRQFRSLHVDPLSDCEGYEDPDEEVQDKVLFVLNNVSEQNKDVKLKDLKKILKDEHRRWFAGYLVEERAKLQPNFQQLYLDLLDMLNDKVLWNEVLRETYVSAIRMLNSESTMSSSTERAHLKNLGGWLGQLTIAKNKPIKHDNIYFKELLIEAHDSSRLVVVIPFTCKVLLQAAKSVVFRPPNPWLMEILSILMELYHFAELKLTLRFEIEVLCTDLDLDHKTIEPSTSIRDRPASIDEEPSAGMLPDTLDAFDELSIGGLNRGMQSERLSPSAILASLPSLDQMLTFPTVSNSMVDNNTLKQIVRTAVERAVAEIITPVVERSITIASIATTQLIAKDFATEADDEKLRLAAWQMVRSLSGSLALVTCKEPLKMSMTNNIRVLNTEYEHPIPEGVILMCVNDNIDVACGLVESTAENRSLSGMERVIEGHIEARKRHSATRPGEPYIDASFSRWATLIPEPYRQSVNGLNKEQMMVYEEFGRQSRGQGTGHVNNASVDSGRQLPDVLQENFANIPSLSTPAEQPAIPHQASQQDAQAQSDVLPSGQVNGYDIDQPMVRAEMLLAKIQEAASTTPEENLKDLPRNSPLLQDYDQLIRMIVTSPSGESIASLVAVKIYQYLYTRPERTLEVELLVFLLAKLCEMSLAVTKTIWGALYEIDDEHLFNVPVTQALVSVGLIDLHRLDTVLTKGVLARKVEVVSFLSALFEKILFNDEPIALRADFASTLNSISQWLAEDHAIEPANALMQKLRENGIPEFVAQARNDEARMKQDQMEYIFEEWIGVYKNPNTTERTYYTFVKELHQRQVINNKEDSALFFRLSVDIAVAVFEQQCQNPTASLDDAFLHTDALAKLIVSLVKCQDESSGTNATSKQAYLSSILSVLVLILNHHQVMRGEAFNQRVFFRLFSSILCEYVMNGLHHSSQHREMMFAFADKFLALQPRHAPGFVYGWLGLISHRVFMPTLLSMEDDAGWEHYCQIMQCLLLYIGEQLKPANVSFVAKDLYKGVLRLLLVLHHDFPGFVAENHYRLCNVIPAHCAQLRNLILSAYPSTFQKLPDPFREGLKVDRLDEMRYAPKVAGDFAAPLQEANIKAAVDGCLRGNSISETAVQQILDAMSAPMADDTGLLFMPVSVDIVLMNSLVLYIGDHAIASHGQKGAAPPVNNSSPHAVLLESLVKSAASEARYYLLSAIANQLRYPNSHTLYFSYVVLFLFGNDSGEDANSEIREAIIRVLLERLIVHRPHPWGLIIALQEILQNRNYSFFRLPFIQAAPEVSSLPFSPRVTISDLFLQIGRLFDALLQHIQQSPRALTN